MTIAILGGGILGTCTALELADRGFGVVLYERNAAPLSEASRYNEGKLHLGFVYAADRSFRTAARMIEGAAEFFGILSRWIPRSQLQTLPARPFDYLVHRDSMVPVAEVEAHFSRVRAHCAATFNGPEEYWPVDPSRASWQRVARDDVAQRYNPDLVAAVYETHEIAVDVWSVAELLEGAVRAHPRVEIHTGTYVESVSHRKGTGYVVKHDSASAPRGPFPAVVNALWANRPAIDASLGLATPERWFTRRKVGVNLLCDVPPAVPSFTIMLGPFGDVVAYRSGRVYLSWYPTCMIGTTTGVEQTDWASVVSGLDSCRIYRDTFEALSTICPVLSCLDASDIAQTIVNGGSIFALGESDIDDPSSRLHERLEPASTGADGHYSSVDTAKYTLGPATAVRTANRIEQVCGSAQRRSFASR